MAGSKQLLSHGRHKFMAFPAEGYHRRCGAEGITCPDGSHDEHLSLSLS